MAINMTEFVPPAMLKPLAWLGKREWIKFSRHQDRLVISTDSDIDKKVGLNERNRYPADHWKKVHGLLDAPYPSDKELLFTYALSRALATGPKMFRPKPLQCTGFENTSVDIPFSQYAQPYETLLIQFPDDYIASKVAAGWSRCPKYVICWYNHTLGIIMVGCQFATMADRIVGILTLDDQQTIESLLSEPVYFEADGTTATDAEDFEVAQAFERIAVNLNLLMMYGDRKHTVTPLNKGVWDRYRELKKRYEKQRNKKGLENLRDYGVGLIDEVRFDGLDQTIGFKVCLVPEGAAIEGGGTHASPKPHWRRGHWCQQPCGPRSSLRKPVLRQPVFVIGKAYKDMEIDLESTEVIYEQKGHHYDPATGTTSP